MSQVWSNLIVVAGVIFGPLFLAYLTGRQRRREKVEDWARQDAVAAEVKRAAEEVNGKLAQIHELVNSTLTAQIEEARTALVQQAVLMREVVALNRAAGREPSQAALDAIDAIDAKVAELAAKLADRAKSTQLADAQVATRR